MGPGLVLGTSACGAYFNLYLLEGMSRWNEDRGREAVKTSDPNLRCYSQQQQQVLNQLTQEFYGLTLVETYTEAREYTGTQSAYTLTIRSFISLWVSVIYLN